MNALMFRVYAREPKMSPHFPTKWKVIACFIHKWDALKYADSKFDADTQQVKIMRANKNVRVYE